MKKTFGGKKFEGNMAFFDLRKTTILQLEDKKFIDTSVKTTILVA